MIAENVQEQIAVSFEKAVKEARFLIEQGYAVTIDFIHGTDRYQLIGRKLIEE